MRALLTLGLVATLAAGVMAQGPAEPKVGDMAPDFELPSTTGGSVRLSSHRGARVLLWFFPRADTPG